jgi:hypothetical protein
MVKELYFLAPDGQLMAVSITASGETFAAGTPAALFPAGVVPGSGINKQEYMVSGEGFGDDVAAAPHTGMTKRCQLHWIALAR